MTTEALREEFRRHVLAAAERTRAGDAEAANAEGARAESAISQSDDVPELLEPLLADPDAEVRFAAASWLLNNGRAEVAEPALEVLADEGGPTAPQAKILLRWWGKQVR